MSNRFVLGAAATVLTTSCLAVLASVILVGGPTLGLAADDDGKKAAATGGYELVAPLDAIMHVMEDNLFKKIPARLDAAQFKDLRREAYVLAEVANLTAHAKEFRGKKEWVEMSMQMKDAALKLADAADPKKKDVAAAKAQQAAIEKSCDSCHEKFRD